MRALLRRRRLLAVLAAVAIMVMAAAAARQKEPASFTFRVTLGLKDREPSDWSGKLAVTGGEIAGLSGWRFEGQDRVADDKSGWKCQTRNLIEPGKRYPLLPPTGKAPEPPLQPWPNGVTLTVRGNKPAVAIKLPRGEIKFDAAGLRLGEPKEFLDGAVRVERMPETKLLRPPSPPKSEDPIQDDYPALWVRYKTGKHYLAWVAYQKEKDRVLLAERDGPDGEWSKPVEVAGPGDHFRVALASTHDDTLWVVWSSQRKGNWDLYGRPYKGGKLGAEVRLTDAPGPDIWHRMTTDRKGRAWLVWQGARGGQFDIFARCADADGWHEPVRVSEGKANDWDPCIAADYKEDRVWVGWDSYETGNYQVRVRSLAGGPEPKPGELLTPEKDRVFGAHVSLACGRDGRLWAAWDGSGYNWGKDAGYLYQASRGTKLYAWRSIRVRCLENGQWKGPAAGFRDVLPADMKEFCELPQLQDDGEGRIWMAFRHRTCRRPRADAWAAQGRWDVYATAFLGDRWLTPFELPRSGGRNDMRISSQRDKDGNVYFAYASDNRGWMPPGMPPRNHSIAVSKLGGAARPAEFRLDEADFIRKGLPPVHPNEAKDVARVRGYKVEHQGKTYRIYRGDLHRHTDISTDGVGDGSLMDFHRYALDAAALDFAAVTDHNMGNDNEYSWWRTQKANDLYTVPGHFLSVYGYERSVPYPNGHRNVLWAERGHRTLPLPRAAIPAQMKADTGKLYAYLRQTSGICTAHTSATDQGTTWQEFDGGLEPIVEIFQGFHASYEMPGAPKAVSDRSDRVHGEFRPDGFISKALAKGYRLGFQSSSDHTGTHVSYACVLAEEFSRKGLIEAMKKRHTYAATDNIVLDVRCGGGIMGDEVRVMKPEIAVVVLGTGPIDRVDVIRDGEVVHAERPGKAEARFRWEDPSPRKGEKASYYYVRVLQKDGQMAWASPIWVQVAR